ncbi:multicopper oxidase family protein [Alicyclobacillus kakegawensis]|uniref:multicopper oxidase family protein n=1 Tax=Alicyclobacillus kakegawensis TaxID=392012 RepID=UPI00082F184D|nr:multicopper oxidase domain-containing protein [Alicyclobacillus kakegawensis]
MNGKRLKTRGASDTPLVMRGDEQPPQRFWSGWRLGLAAAAVGAAATVLGGWLLPAHAATQTPATTAAWPAAKPTDAATDVAADATPDGAPAVGQGQAGALADGTLHEQALKPQVLPDGTKRFVLTAAPVRWPATPGRTVQAWALNGQVPGPLIRVQVGDRVQIVVRNHLPEDTTLHWHGMAVPNAMDGVPGMPTPAIRPGASFTYTFTITSQMVGTHWYHSHVDDDLQVDMGMYGPIVVDGRGAADTQPKADVDALVMFGAFKVDGMDDENLFTVNGQAYPLAPTLHLRKGQRVRLRLVNASAESYHAITLDGYDLTLVSEDGQPQPDPQSMAVVSLAPSETADVEFTANRQGTWLLRDTLAANLENPDAQGLGGAEMKVRVE